MHRSRFAHKKPASRRVFCAMRTAFLLPRALREKLCEKSPDGKVLLGNARLLKVQLVKTSVQATIADDTYPEALDLQAVRAQVDLDR